MAAAGYAKTVCSEFDGCLETLSMDERDTILWDFYDNAPLFMGVVEWCDNQTDLRYLLGNRAACRILQETPESLIGKKASQTASAETVLLYLNACQEAKQTGCAVRFVYSHVRKNQARFAAATVSFCSKKDADRFVIIVEDVTERHNAKQELLLLQIAVQNAHDALLITQISAKPGEEHTTPPEIVYVNPAFEALTGYAASEVLGQSPQFLTPPQDQQKKIRDAVQAGNAARIEYVLRKKNRESIWVEMTVQAVAPAPEMNAKPYQIGVLRDISARKSAEAQLRLRDRAIDASSCGIVIVDAQKENRPIIYVNPAYETMTGYKASEVLGAHPGETLKHSLSDPAAGRALREAMEHHRELNITVQNQRKNGDPLWREIHISPIHDAQGIVTHFVAVQNDVTDRQAAQIALSEAEARLRYVIQNLPLVVFAMNADGVFTFSDGKGLELLGLSPGEVVGQNYQAVYRHEPELCDKIARVLRGELTEYTQAIEGTVFETICTPSRGQNGEITSIIGFALDITARTQLEAQILQSDKLAALGQLVAGVAHEINNPLAAISGTAQLLQMHPDEDVKADGDAIKAMTDRANSVVQSLLTYARPSKGTDKERRLYTLQALTEETLQLTRFSLRKADIDVHLYFEPSELSATSVYVNGNQIQQIILNLLTNAEHALRRAPEGSDRHIIITTFTEDGFIHLTVADNGCGISPAVQKRIFDPFFTTKDVGEGTGLGLSICQGIAAAHNGTLHVESTEGVGAAFTLRLPIARIAQEENL